MDNKEYGIMQIRTTRASEALPLEGALVKITGSGEDNTYVKYSEITNQDGLTKELKLPTPSKSLSMSPNATAIPYSVFDVEIVKDGYYPKKIVNIPIFSGIKAVLPIEMIPLAYSENGEIIHLKNLNSIIYENQHLE